MPHLEKINVWLCPLGYNSLIQDVEVEKGLSKDGGTTSSDYTYFGQSESEIFLQLDISQVQTLVQASLPGLPS